MKTRSFLLVVVLVSAMAAGTSAQIEPPPPSWSLGQNYPDPFCGSTRLPFGLAQDAHVQLAVWSADQTAIVRLLIDGMLRAGSHEILWDGRDDQGATVQNGRYLYRLVAQIGGTTVFDSSLMLDIKCIVTVGERAWGALKSLYWP